MSRFRIDHLDGPRFDPIEGRYYGAGTAHGTLPIARNPEKMSITNFSFDKSKKTNDSADPKDTDRLKNTKGKRPRKR